MIGVHFPYDNYDKLTLETSDLFNERSYKIFSFEMKKKIDLGCLRSEYFQAVSNSSRAKEGYLVAPKITTENEDFMSELTLLNGAFGIGVIRLNIDHTDESEILMRGKYKQALDANMPDKLISKNRDAKKICECVSESKRLGKVVEGDKIFDAVFQEEQYQEYVRGKRILEA